MIRQSKQLRHGSRARWAIFSLLIFSTFLSCNDKVESTYTYITQVPVYLKTSEVRAMQVGLTSPKAIAATGKIYVYGDYLFISEPNEGIHVFDNQNPSSPKKIHFLKIPGSVDMAVNTNILYADSYVDLLAFDISDIDNIQLVKRVEDVFPHMFINTEKSMLVTYKDSIVSYTVPQSDPRLIAFNDAAANFSGGGGWTAGGQTYGQGGSMARFTLLKSHLYAVDQSSLRLFDVSQPRSPSFVSDISLGWGIETIFPYKDNLFIGSTTGMHIYDASTPSAPVRKSVYQHFTACDPVVVNDKHAFVTLRSGNFCQQGVDRLEILNIEDLSNPVLLKSYEMRNPHGLGLDGNRLFICEGQYGLKYFNAADVLNIDKNQLEFLQNQKSYDVIPTGKSLIVVGSDGVSQYDYKSSGNLKKLSTISIGNG
ncbi:LVIVD repeat-containing protein [Olivibacter sitiensis]|uniref:LVIVD repeat-containing protein n=1 Tax=Olivibacter sitiensis TaxID=376470 RepID=UPI00068885EE|nr:hypothetical protein [Olivibacter sitiensis]